MWKDERFSRLEGHGGRSRLAFLCQKNDNGVFWGEKKLPGCAGDQNLGGIKWSSQAGTRFWRRDEVLEEVLVWSGGGGGGRGARYRMVQSPHICFSQKFYRNGIFWGNPGGIPPRLPEEVTPSGGRWRSCLAEGPAPLLGVSMAAPKSGPQGPSHALAVATSSRGRRHRGLCCLQQPHPGASLSFSSTAGPWRGAMVLQALGTGTQKVPRTHRGVSSTLPFPEGTPSCFWALPNPRDQISCSFSSFSPGKCSRTPC